MIAVQIASIIAEYVVFLNFTDEDDLNPDTAVDMMESLSAHLELLDRDFLREFIDAFTVVAEEYSGDAQQLVRDIPYHFELEEVLAADDPGRLAELNAIRDARD